MSVHAARYLVVISVPSFYSYSLNTIKLWRLTGAAIELFSIAWLFVLYKYLHSSEYYTYSIHFLSLLNLYSFWFLSIVLVFDSVARLPYYIGFSCG